VKNGIPKMHSRDIKRRSSKRAPILALALKIKKRAHRTLPGS